MFVHMISPPQMQKQSKYKPTKVRPKVLSNQRYLIIIIIIENNTVQLYCIDINYGYLWTTRQPYAYMQQW